MNFPRIAPRRVVLAAAVAAALFLPAVVPGQEKDEKMESSKPVALPKKVHEALHAKFPKVELGTQSKETEDGKTVYDVEFTQEGTKFEADFFEDGTILNWEQEMAASALPAAVKTALEAKYPGATAGTVMAVTGVKGGKDVLEGYEVMLKGKDGKESEVMIAPDGKIIEEGGDED